MTEGLIAAVAAVPITLRPELEALLSTRPAWVAEAVRRTVTDVRPCVRLESERASPVPIRGPWLGRLLRQAPPQAVLPVTASKFGGVPYMEGPDELGDRCFIGQVNFAHAAQALAAQGCPVPEGMPAAGILAVDLGSNYFGGSVRWYPDPSESRCVQSSRAVYCVAKYEAAIRFRGSWSLRGLAWFDAVAYEDHELWEYMNELDIAGVDEDGRDGHKLFGHANEALNDVGNFKPDAGRAGSSIRKHALVWRIDYDNPAGFAWGTNWLYVVVHSEDLARGAFEKSVVTVANA